MAAPALERTRRSSAPEVFAQRVTDGYSATNPTDNLVATLRLQGGGLSAGRVLGMVTALDDLGVLDVINGAIPISAGAHIIAGGLAGNPREGLRHFINPNFVRRREIVRGGRTIDVHRLAEQIVNQVDTDKLFDSNRPPIEWTTTSATTGKSLTVSAPTSATELYDRLVWSSLAPYLSGRPVDGPTGHKVMDNGLAKGGLPDLPTGQDENGRQEVTLYLLSRRQGSKRKRAPIEKVGAGILFAQGYRKAAELLISYNDRANTKQGEVENAARRSLWLDPESTDPHVSIISVPANEPDLSMMEGNPVVMLQAARAGYKAVMDIFIPLGLNPRRRHQHSMGEIYLPLPA